MNSNEKMMSSLSDVLKVLFDVAWDHSEAGGPTGATLCTSDLIDEIGAALDIPPELITSASVAVALRMLRDRVGA